MDGEVRDAEKEGDCDRAEDAEGRRGVLAVGSAEGVDAVGDRLDAGQRRRARRKGPQ